MFSKHKKLIQAIAIYLLLVAGVLAASLYICRGDFVYALDDPYIHMDMAKNLVNYGHFATNMMSFASASSSPLWVIIVSGVYFVTGTNLLTPFILNLLFQILSIIILYNILKYFAVTEFLLPLILGFILLTPLGAILFTGMEHSAQVCFALLFIFYAARFIAAESKEPRLFIYLLIIAPVLAGLRYESMVLVSAVCLLLLLKKKLLNALLLFAVGLLPIVIYGIISKSNGWFFLPNTILLKSTPPGGSVVDILRFGIKAFKNISEPHIFASLVISSFLYAYNFKCRLNFWDKRQVFLVIAIITTVSDMSLIEYHQNGAFYRYEAFLMAVQAAAIAVNLSGALNQLKELYRAKITRLYKYIMIVLLIIVVSPLIRRAFTLFEIPVAIREYHNQQYQMAQFVKKYLPGENIAANDIGMLSYYNDAKVVDLWGVADINVAREKLNKTYNTNTISELTKKDNVKLAVLYEHWFDEYGGLPPAWQKIGEWSMTDYNFFLGVETVNFYCVNNKDSEDLAKKLEEYSKNLPPSVVYKIFGRPLQKN